ncbi:MAG: DUF4446 family protein [Candidatus Velthaea sp.]
MQNLSSAVLVALGGALVVFGGYHTLVVAPKLRRLSQALDAHDALLSGGTGKATDRIVALETSSGDLARRGAELDRRLTALESSFAEKLPHIGFVRYNAFDNTGSDLSYALALLTKNGDGVVISSIWSREETRTFGKAVTGFTSAQDASGEELAAIAKARASAL